MRFNAVVILSMSILISACATFPQNREDQATYYADEAATAIAKGDSTKAGDHIYVALARPTGDAKIKALFAKYPKGQDYYRTYLEKMISDMSSPYQASTALETLSIAKSAGVFPENQMSDLFAKLMKAVAGGNTTDSVPFYLGDKIEQFPELKSPSHQQIIVNRSIKSLQGNGAANRHVEALIDYVQRVGVNSVEGRRIESLLPTMNIRSNELDSVAKIFPTFTKARKEEITARVFVQLKNGDRLLAEDILQALRNKVRGVEWVPSSSAKTTTVVIERVRNDEKTMPERSQTITYAQHEVDSFKAVMLMPRNASFLYDVISGGAEIEYGYVVTASDNGKQIYDEVVRGKVGGDYRRCQNSRIQNVFGGVSSADFVANDDMKQRCSGSTTISMENLRNDVFSKVVESVVKIPPIKLVQELN